MKTTERTYESPNSGDTIKVRRDEENIIIDANGGEVPIAAEDLGMLTAMLELFQREIECENLPPRAVSIPGGLGT